MAVLSSIARASRALVLTGTVSNGQTVTIGGKVYTFQATLTNSDGNVKLGAAGDAAESLANLAAAIDLGPGAGTKYAAAMTKNPHCRVQAVTNDSLTVESRVVGAIGNFVPLAETLDNGAWAGGATALGGGVGSIAVAIDEIRRQDQVNASILQAFDVIDGSSAGEG